MSDPPIRNLLDGLPPPPVPDLPLRGLHLPEPIGWWPPAPGWWILAGTLLGAVALVAWLLHRRRRITPIRLALRELARLEADAAAAPGQTLRELAMLLRRTALTLHPRENTAGLVGADWLAWLDQTLGDSRFSRGPGRLLVEAQYRREIAAPLDELLTLSRDWLTAQAKTKAGNRTLRAPPAPRP